MEEVKSNAGQNLGIAALITGIITFVLAVIPCVGVIAFIPGVITVILASVGLSQASRTNAPRGIIVAGLVIGIVSLLISFSQIFVAGEIAKNADKWPGDIKDVIEEVTDDMKKELDKGDVSIKIESNGEKIEINASSGADDERLKKLEQLEGEKSEKNDSTAGK
jgi:predicted PurR-regulated permease PerM